MMWTLLQIVAGFAFVWWTAQLVCAIDYRRAMHRSLPAVDDSCTPRFVVFIPVRGFDPTLLEAIRSVLAVDYPAFTVRILFDSREDAAWGEVSSELDRICDARVSMHVYEQHRENCSLLNNNLVAAIDELGDDACDLIAICAADMVVHPQWLRALARGMVDPRAGATLGNRWHVPPVASLGGLSRWLWNAGAVVAMRWCQIPWSGGMTVRLSELRCGGLRDRWAKAMVEDVSVASHFSDDLRRLRFLPDLVVTTHDDIGLRKAYVYISRQLLWTRLYSPRWLVVAANALTGGVATFAPLVLAIGATLAGAWSVAAFSVLVFLLYHVGMLALLPIVASGVSQSQAGPIQPFAGLPVGIVLAAIPLTQVVYLAAFLRATFTRSVEWRGIQYEIDGPWQVRMRGYTPYGRSLERP